MKKKTVLFVLLTLTALLLTGCAMRTVDEMYALPKRADSLSQLQSAIDSAMAGLEYSAPISGDHQQTVQTADLDGDGTDEYLVFASGGWENPLQVLIFRQNEDGTCGLLDTIKGNGTAFEQVEYVAFDDRPGKDIVIGYQVSDQVLRSVCVYSLAQDSVEQLLLVGYSRFLTCDFNDDGFYELLVMRPGEYDSAPGVSVVYSSVNKQILRSEEAPLSIPASQIDRMQVGSLSDDTMAVLVSGQIQENRVLTDILITRRGNPVNIAYSEEADSGVESFCVFPTDIDGDGVVEFAEPLDIRPVTVWKNDSSQSLLRWSSVGGNLAKTDKLFTFHNFQQGWYLSLDKNWSQWLSVVQGENSFSFYLWSDDMSEATALFSIYTLTGINRNEGIEEEGRFRLRATETTVYAAKLEPDAATYGITREYIQEAFDLIRLDRPRN